MVTIPARRPLDDETIADLRGSVRGTVLTRGDEGYDEVRAVWNAMIDRYPSAIVRCSGVADVIAAVDVAREHDLLVTVKGGGHNVAGLAVADGALTIDCSPMNGIRVDPGERTVRVGAGATWRDLDRETQAFGLAVPGGLVSSTGVAGFTLGGGFGWLSRKHGLALDNLRSVDVVTADGEYVTASADANEDLFWGVRGGGGNFGVATAFEFECHEVGPEVFGGMAVYPFEAARDGLRTYRDFLADAPEEVFVLAGLRRAPPAPFLPSSVHGELIFGVTTCYAGDPGEAERVLAPLREFADPIADLVGLQPYTSLQQIMDVPNAPGARNYWKSHFLAGLPDDAIDTLLERAREITSPESAISLHSVGGAIADVPADATAYAHREAPFVLNAVARWRNPGEDDRHVDWARDTFEAATPYSTGGVYVNFLSRGEERVRAAYGENYERLVEVKNRYDPGNLFRTNQNVEPTGDGGSG